ncbi:tetratricopeptide repeat protein [Candidatus Gracilibacteria bacterium]|nr:tetratricopeptide repeat protein [Candidatus Gracilibacteria bacterium]
MIKKLGLFFLFLLIFIFINSSHIRSYYYNTLGDKYYAKQDLEKSIDYFKKADNDSGNYNLGNIHYVKRDYDSAIKYFEKVGEYASKDLLFRTNHNLGNAYYRIGEIDLENNLKYFEMSLKFYEKALNLFYDKETKSNYDFVLDKIKNLENNKDNSSKESQEDNSNSQEKNEEKSSESDQKNSSSNEGNTQENNEKNNQDGNDGKENDGESSEKLQEKQESKLTGEQIKAIEEYKEMLEKEQNYNSEGFNKVYEGDNMDIFESFFNNSLLENDDKKDW